MTINSVPRGFNANALAMPGYMQPLVLPLAQGSFSNVGKPYDLSLNAASPLVIGQPGFLDLQLYDSLTGAPPAQLQIMHEKLAHVFIVNQDLSDFQHVHPEVLRPGLLRLPVQFKAPGNHKLFIQFKPPEKGEQTLNKPFQLGSVQPPAQPLVPDAHWPKTVDGYTFRISGLPTRQSPMGMPQVEVTQNGMPVRNIQPYLGAGAHGVIISQDMQSFIHTHPMSQPVGDVYQSPLMFHTQIDKPGLYKMWVQTRINDQIHTVDWTFQV